MRKLIYCLAFLSALLFWNCETDDIEQKQEIIAPKGITQEYVSIDRVPEIIPALIDYNSQYQYLHNGSNPAFSSRDADSLSLDLDLEHILKVVDAYGKESYSISIRKAFSENEDIFFENLYIYEKAGQAESLIFRYSPSDAGEDFKIETFTGLMEIFNKDRGLIGHIEFENGDKKHVKWVLDFGCWQLYLSTESYMIYDACGSGGGSNEHSGDEGYYGSDGGYSGNGNGVGNYGYPTPNPSDPTLQNHHTVIPNTNWPESVPLATAIFKVYKKIGKNNPVLNTWLQEHPEDALTFYEFLRYQTQNQEFVEGAAELLFIASEETEDTEAISNLLYMSLYSQEHGHLHDTSFNPGYYHFINHFVEVDTVDPLTLALWQAHFKAQCAILRWQNPTWGNARIYWEASKEMFHLGLDLLGLVPVFGEVADLTNGVIYTIEGDGVNASLSYASAIPIVGWASTSAKFAIKTVNIGGAATTTLKWIKRADNVITFGNRGQLRRVLGLTSNSQQAHHILSWAASISEHSVIQKAASIGSFHMNQVLNGVAVAAWRNQPNHNLYTQRVFQRLEAFRQFNPNATPQECNTFLIDLISDIRTAIVNNPDLHLNEITF